MATSRNRRRHEKQWLTTITAHIFLLLKSVPINRTRSHSVHSRVRVTVGRCLILKLALFELAPPSNREVKPPTSNKPLGLWFSWSSGFHFTLSGALYRTYYYVRTCSAHIVCSNCTVLCVDVNVYAHVYVYCSVHCPNTICTRLTSISVPCGLRPAWGVEIIAPTSKYCPPPVKNLAGIPGCLLEDLLVYWPNSEYSRRIIVVDWSGLVIFSSLNFHGTKRQMRQYGSEKNSRFQCTIELHTAVLYIWVRRFLTGETSNATKPLSFIRDRPSVSAKGGLEQLLLEAFIIARTILHAMGLSSRFVSRAVTRKRILVFCSTEINQCVLLHK